MSVTSAISNPGWVRTSNRPIALVDRITSTAELEKMGMKFVKLKRILAWILQTHNFCPCIVEYFNDDLCAMSKEKKPSVYSIQFQLCVQMKPFKASLEHAIWIKQNGKYLVR